MRSHDDKQKIKKFPKWKQNLAWGNPPARYRRRWRQKARARWNHLVRTCNDWDLLQLFPLNKITYTWEWY